MPVRLGYSRKLKGSGRATCLAYKLRMVLRDGKKGNRDVKRYSWRRQIRTYLGRHYKEGLHFVLSEITFSRSSVAWLDLKPIAQLQQSGLRYVNSSGKVREARCDNMDAISIDSRGNLV